MKTARTLTLLFLVLCSTNALAGSAYESLQFGKYKQQIVSDLKKVCHTQKKISDEELANKILSSEENKGYIREARIALERNNEKNYWNAIGNVECPEM